MRTNVVLDDQLVATAMKLTGLKTKRAVLDEALRTLVRLRKQTDLRKLYGKLRWEGDLAKSRAGRNL